MTTRVKKANRPAHVSKGNVLEDLGFSADEAAAMELKIQLHLEIMKVVKRRKLAPRDLVRILAIPQPRVSELLRGKIFEGMTADRLATYLGRLGRTVEVRTKPSGSKRPTEAA
jgi:predicted XRE-type DNA-binding protein